MPTYDYRCQACNHEFEEFQSITAKVLKKCPQCGKLQLQRLIGTGAGVIFRGSGFYETDYRSDSYKKEAKAAEDSGKSKSTSDSTKKTDTTTKQDSSTSAKKKTNSTSD